MTRALACALLLSAGCKSMIVIAHRGACGYRPEHTIEAYRLAIEQGADFIEPDLVPTSDGVLIARHENDLAGTTDVAERFPDRKTTKTIDGKTVTGWFSEDFTLAEIKTLRCRERIPKIRPQNTKYDGQFEIPTFREVLALAREHGVGVYPETKHPTYFQGLGHDISEMVVKALVDAKFRGPVYIQSFEAGNLIALKEEIMPRHGVDFPLIQLLGPLDEHGFGDMVTEEGLRDIRRYAVGIGPWKGSLSPAFVARAKHAGLLIHTYTVRAEPHFQAEGMTVQKELALLKKLGVDGVFIDQPDVAVTAGR